jgi:hypothetical protein
VAAEDAAAESVQGFKFREKKNFRPQRETMDSGNSGISEFFIFSLFYFLKKLFFSQKIIKY